MKAPVLFGLGRPKYSKVPPTPRALHQDLKRSRMVTVLGGEGHGVYPSGNACTDGTVTGYLLTGKLPAKDVFCCATAESNAEARQNQRRDEIPGSPLPERAPDRFWVSSYGTEPCDAVKAV